MKEPNSPVTPTLLIALLAATASPAAAELNLPYANRTRPYNGTHSTVRGDIRTVGMAGATIGLADTFIAAQDNPAGLAMTINVGDINVTNSWVRDGSVQQWDTPTYSKSFGFALSPYPWGFSIGSRTSYAEGQEYGVSGIRQNLGLELHEFRVAAARLFFENQLSLGMALGFGHANQLMEDSTFYGLTPTFGAMVQLPQRFLLGLSYQFPTTYPGNPGVRPPGVDGFAQPIVTAGRLGFGLGWIPNRFFRCDLSLLFLGPTHGAALLRDQSISVGDKTTVQPRIGGAYDFVEFHEFRATAFAGTYYEQTRIQGESSRLHLTFGVEAKPWVLTVGTGADFAPDYRNFMVSLGLDVIRTLQKADLVPIPPRPPFGNVLPPMLGLSDQGLARPLITNWQPEGPEIDPIQVGLELPGKIEQKVRDAGKNLHQLGKDVFGKKKAAPKSTPAKSKPSRNPKE